MNMKKIRLLFTWIILIAFLGFLIPINPVTAEPLPDDTTAQQPMENTEPPSTLSYIIGASVVSFDSQGVSLAIGEAAYQVRFVDSQAVAPLEEDQANDSAFTGMISYDDLWSGITLTYDSPDGTGLRSTYELQPQADPSSIQLAYNHPVSITTNGKLSIDLDGVILTETAPVAWQEVDGVEQPVDIAFRLIDNPAYDQSLVGFELGGYNPELPLTIDPTLVWNSFFSTSFSRVLAVDVDPTGQYIYAIGYSMSAWGTPLNPYAGGSDITLAKFDTGMNLLWHTFWGGEDREIGKGVYIDTNGDIYITGQSDGNWGTPVNPHTSGTNGFVAMLDSDGALIWNTFLGNADCNVNPSEIAIAGNAIVIAGTTSSGSWGSPINPFPDNDVTNGFVARLNKTSGTLTWNTFFGGLGNPTYSSFNSVDVQGMGVDSSGNVYVGGRTGAYSFTGLGSPIRARRNDGSFDCYVIKFSSAGADQWYTFLGGMGNDASRGFSVDSSGNAFITGPSPETWGSPINAWTSERNWFVARVNSNGSLAWNTFLYNKSGGNFHLLKLDESSNIYLTGEWEQSWGSPDPNMPYSGGRDGQIIVLNRSGALQWHGFFGSMSTAYMSDIVDSLSVYNEDAIYVLGQSSASWGSPLQPWSSENMNYIVRIGPANSAPTDITLSPAGIPENEPVNTTVGSFTTTDPDTGNLFTYTLVSGTGDDDNSSFNISGASLRTSESFDYEVKTSYTIRVRSTDQSGGWVEKQFTVSVTNIDDNAAPTDIALSKNSVAENSAVNTVVGTLSSTDPDPDNTFTYSLVSGTGSDDNASFNISGTALRTSVALDYEIKNNLSIRVRTTDQDGATYDEVFTISVTNVNEIPTDISLSSASVAENQAINTVVGTLSTTDPDTGDTFTYALVSGTGDDDNGTFNLFGASLRTSAVFDYEARTSYSIRVRTTDLEGLSYEEVLTISVTNVTENTTTTILDTPDPSVYGQSYTVSVNVVPGNGVGVPTGTVDVSDGNNACSITLASGAGNCDLPSGDPQTVTLTATYSGDVNWNGSSDTESHTIQKAATLTTIVSDSADPSEWGSDYTVSVIVTAVAPGSGTPTGTVVVSDGSEDCTISLVSGSGSCDLPSDGVASLTLSATYGGDAGFEGSSDTEPHTVEDTTAPTVTINQAAFQVDPTNLDAIVFVALFSEDVTGFEADDINYSGTTAPGTLLAEIIGSGSLYQVIVRGMTDSGLVEVSIPANRVQDPSGNYNTASTSTDNQVTYDVTNLVVTVNQDDSQVDPTKELPIVFEVVFNKPVTGFEVDDLIVHGISGTPVIVLTGAGTTYTVEISGVGDGETVTVEVEEGGAQDIAGNTNLASTSTDNHVTYDVTCLKLQDEGVIGRPGNTSISDGGKYFTQFTTLGVKFDSDAYNPPGSTEENDVTNPDNYFLIRPGTNSEFEISGCEEARMMSSLPDTDDTLVPLGPVTYDNNDGQGPFVATLALRYDVRLPLGSYRLLVCGASLMDLAMNPLNDGEDSVVNFSIMEMPETLPDTGFPVGEVSILASQPAGSTYQSTGLFLALPSLGVSTQIVGVPLEVDGWNTTWLGNNAGFLEGSAFPTTVGNTIITGHIWTATNQPGIFLNVDSLCYGDEIQIYAWGQVYTYAVRSNRIVSEGNVPYVMQSEALDWVTLITCETYDPATGEYMQRRVVRAVLVSVE